VKNFIAGGIGGVCTVASGHPFDTIKVRLQTMPQPMPGSKPMFNGMIDCFRKTVAGEGIRALYKGMATPLLGVAPSSALFFAGCVVGRWIQESEPGQKHFTVVENFQSGAMAGLFSFVIVTPGDRIKCMLQTQTSTQGDRYSGPMALTKKLYKEGGLRSLYQGTSATLLRDVPSLGAFLSVYEYLKYKLSASVQKELSLWSTIMAGGVAGMVTWAVCIPADVIKSRIQIAPYSPGNRNNAIWSVFKATVREGGILALYRGFVPIMLRAFPANAACFLGLEVTLWAFNQT